MTEDYVYQNHFYKVVPNDTMTGYLIVNKFTDVREGGSEKLPSAISQADVANQLMIEIVQREQTVEGDH